MPAPKADAPAGSQPKHFRLGYLTPSQMKNINWKNIGTIALVVVVGIVTAPLWLPTVKSLVSKIPVIGPKLA